MLKPASLRIIGLFLLLAVGCQGEAIQGVGGGDRDPAFETTVLQSSQPVLVDFHASWCGPCRTMMPIVEELASEYAGKAIVHKVDIDEFPGTARDYGIDAIPAFLIFDGGKVVERIVGGTAKAELADLLDAAAQ